MPLYSEMPHRARQDRPSYSRDDVGGNTEVYTVIASSVACWPQNASMREVEQYQKRDEEIIQKVFFETRPAVEVGDRFCVISGPSHVGQDLVFLADADRSAGLGVVFAAICRLENNVRPVHLGIGYTEDDDTTVFVTDSDELIVA